jgi:AcrR family transcriptional regulator
MSTQVVRPYKGVSADERRAQRRERLMEAGLDVLGSEGIAGLTMTEVCARAGLTERYFYESFRNRDELIEALFAASDEETMAAVFAALEAAPRDLFEVSRAAAAAIIGVLTEDPRKARAYVEAIGSEAARTQRDRSVRAYAELLAEQMRDLRGLTEKRRQAPLRLATTMLVGGLSEAIIGWLDGSLEMSRDEVADEIARLTVAAADAVAATP